jgi:hypothetical protein
MNTTNDIKQAIAPFATVGKTPAIMTEAINNNVYVSGGTMQSDWFGQHTEADISSLGTDVLATLYLASIIKTEKNFESVAQRLAEFSKGIYSRRGGGSAKPIVKAIPETIADLTPEQLVKTMTKTTYTIQLNPEQVNKLGVENYLSVVEQANNKASREDYIQKRQIDKEKMAILDTYFDIIEAHIGTESANQIVYTARVTSGNWKRTKGKIVETDNWYYNDLKPILGGDDIVTNYTFTLVHVLDTDTGEPS